DDAEKARQAATAKAAEADKARQAAEAKAAEATDAAAKSAQARQAAEAKADAADKARQAAEARAATSVPSPPTVTSAPVSSGGQFSRRSNAEGRGLQRSSPFLVDVASIVDCEQACARSNTCKVYTYAKIGGSCYMYSANTFSVDDLVPNALYDSGVLATGT